MAKKSTKKKASDTTRKKTKSAAKTAKKTTKKVTKKAATKPAKKTTKKATAKTPTKKVTKKKVAKKAATTKKVTKKVTKKTTKKADATKGDPKDNGKADAHEQPTAPAPTIRRVVRPTPPPQEEPSYDDWTPLSDAKLKRIKSGLGRKDLNEFKQLLLEKRAEIVGDVMGMEEARSAGGGGELSNMPLHMADIGSDNYEQEFTLGLVESERKLLIEIDAALGRIQNKTYGVCIITGTPIPKVRLEIKPWAKYSIEIVREREKRGLHSF